MNFAVFRQCSIFFSDDLYFPDHGHFPEETSHTDFLYQDLSMVERRSKPRPRLTRPLTSPGNLDNHVSPQCPINVVTWYRHQVPHQCTIIVLSNRNRRSLLDGNFWSSTPSRWITLQTWTANRKRRFLYCIATKACRPQCVERQWAKSFRPLLSENRWSCEVLENPNL